MKFDVAVIGGGPAGMMAAGRAGELGARVVLIEKNARLGIKLLATGGGRCNLANRKDSRAIISQLGQNGKFLFSALHRFGSKEVMDFFISHGVPLKVEDNDRVFPNSGKAADILGALNAYMHKSKVSILTGSAVNCIVKDGSRIEKIVLADDKDVFADKFIIATGGRSYPATGSDGGAYEWLRELGHTIVAPRPALAPLVVCERFIKDLQGLSLPDVDIGVFKGEKKIIGGRGEAIFTGDGLSGPAIINLSKYVGEILPAPTHLKMDFFPRYDIAQLDKKIQEKFGEESNKQLKNGLDGWLPPRLATIIIGLSELDPAKQLNSVTREERKLLVRMLKDFQLEVRSLAGFDKAMVTAGGVALNEIDPQTMRSKIIDNLYLAGEILDLDGPTGGYNLQIAWSTGYAAGSSTGITKALDKYF